MSLHTSNASRTNATAGLPAVVSRRLASLVIGLLASLPAQLSFAEAPDPIPEFEYHAELRDSPWDGPQVDLVRVDKSERRLELLAGGNLVAEYEVSLGREPEGPKRQRGDQRTPEGRYVIDWRKPNSDYHLALHISYPNSEDRRRARKRGVDPGGAIMIHGLPNELGVIGAAHRLSDWTDGCIAVTNSEIEEIWERVPDGVPIEIWP